MKKVSGDYGLEDEDLGILAMKSILPEKGDRQLHLNIYSSYPEKESDTSYIEVWSQDGGLQGDFGVSYQRNNPMQLLKVSEFDIEVFQMNRFNKTLSRESRLPADKISDKSSNSLDGFQRDNPFNINGQRSSLPLGKIREIYQNVHALQDIVEKPVNLEAILGDSGRGGLLDFVQFRPVPALDSDREVKNIGNVPLEYRTLATTPFVKGSYSVEAPLYRPIMPDFKNRPYWIEMPHIQVEGKGNNASRSYMDDPYAEALINSDFASSLAHEEQIGYSFKERDSWKEMGVLEEGFWEYVENFMQEGHVKDEKGIERPYEISSVPFRIDSDGRKGKISIHKDYLNY